jgi:hypothetical protein
VATHNLFAAMAPAASNGRLVVEDTCERTIHYHRRLMPYLESAFGERVRTEYVLVLRRGSNRRSAQLASCPGEWLSVDHAELGGGGVDRDQQRSGHRGEAHDRLAGGQAG